MRSFAGTRSVSGSRRADARPLPLGRHAEASRRSSASTDASDDWHRRAAAAEGARAADLRQDGSLDLDRDPTTASGRPSSTARRLTSPGGPPRAVSSLASSARSRSAPPAGSCRSAERGAGRSSPAAAGGRTTFSLFDRLVDGVGATPAGVGPGVVAEPSGPAPSRARRPTCHPSAGLRARGRARRARPRPVRVAGRGGARRRSGSRRGTPARSSRALARGSARGPRRGASRAGGRAPRRAPPLGVEDRIDADLQLGRHPELVPELEALVAGEPYRERLRRQLIVALYRSGRQADAQTAYADARRTLIEELGTEPGRELQELQRAVLRQDRSLDAPAAASALPAQPQPAESRKTVTVLIADVTPADTPDDPEARRAAMLERTRAVELELDRHGAAVTTLGGVRILGVFGVPSARDDDSLRAVTAAVALRSSGLAGRVGLSTGEVVTGDPVVSGAPVDEAARLMERLVRARCSARREPGGSCGTRSPPRPETAGGRSTRSTPTPLRWPGASRRGWWDEAGSSARSRTRSRAPPPRAALTSSRLRRARGRQDPTRRRDRGAPPGAGDCRSRSLPCVCAGGDLRRRSARRSLHWAARTSRPGSGSVWWRTTAHGSPSSWPRPSRSPPGPRTPRTPPSRPAGCSPASRESAHCCSSSRTCTGPPRVPRPRRVARRARPGAAARPLSRTTRPAGRQAPLGRRASQQLGDPPRRAAADRSGGAARSALLDRAARHRGASADPRRGRGQPALHRAAARRRARGRPGGVPRLDPDPDRGSARPAGRARSRRRRGRCHLRHLVCRRGRRRCSWRETWRPPSWRSSGGS